MKRSQVPIKKNKPLSKGISTLKRGSGIKKKPKSQEQFEIEQMTRDADKRFYEELWKKRPHRCQECNRYLGEELNIAYLDHLLEKHKYPALRYTDKNIFICCLEHHSAKTNGFPGPNHKLAIEKAKKELL